MRVVIYAQDLSARKDDGYYTKPDLSSALDIFFSTEEADIFLDGDGTAILLRGDAEEIFRQDRRVTFYNSDGEKVVISYDPSS
jgi:hypothetical protein